MNLYTRRLTPELLHPVPRSMLLLAPFILCLVVASTGPHVPYWHCCQASGLQCPAPHRAASQRTERSSPTTLAAKMERAEVGGFLIMNDQALVEGRQTKLRTRQNHELISWFRFTVEILRKSYPALCNISCRQKKALRRIDW